MAKKSFTLIELLISLGILGLILGISAPFLISFNNSQELDSVTDEMVSIFRKAQTNSINGEKDAIWGIDFSQLQKYILFSDNQTGPLFDTETYEIPKSISLTVNNNRLKFEKLTGKINQNFEATLTGGNKQYKISINQEGTIDYYKLNQ